MSRDLGRDEAAARTTVDSLSRRLGKHIGVTFCTPARSAPEWAAHERFPAAVPSGSHAILSGPFGNLGAGGRALYMIDADASSSDGTSHPA